MIEFDEASEKSQGEANLSVMYFIRDTLNEKNCGGLGKIRSDWERLEEVIPSLEKRFDYLYKSYFLKQLERHDTFKNTNATPVAFVSYEHFVDKFRENLEFLARFDNKGSNFDV